MTAFRLDPALLDAVQARTDNVTAAVEEGLRLWLARERRKAAKAPSPDGPAQQQPPRHSAA